MWWGRGGRWKGGLRSGEGMRCVGEMVNQYVSVVVQTKKFEKKKKTYFLCHLSSNISPSILAKTIYAEIWRLAKSEAALKVSQVGGSAEG